MMTVADILIAILVAAGSIFLTLIAAFATAYIFGYGFTFGSVAAKRRIGIIAVHEVEERIARPFKKVAHEVHQEEVKLNHDLKHDEHDVKKDINKMNK